MAKRSVDPTKTTTVRRQFLGEVSRRFRDLVKRIREVVVDEDGFGLIQPDPNVIPLRTNRGQFEFVRSSEKVDAFLRWLEAAQAAAILEVQPGRPMTRSGQVAWADKYVDTAYQRGIRDAGRKLRGAGVIVDDGWIANAFNRPIHADRLGLIYTRVFRELKGITEAMDQRISRSLAQGIAEGRGAREIARQLAEDVSNVGITRAKVLARTEVIGAHAEATLNSFEEAGVDGVEVESEFATARDSRVCPQCRGLEGRRFTLQEARGVIPVHPNCLPGDSLVLSRDGIAAASKRRYDGDLIVIRTAAHRELRCTPNHPILTAQGWLPAHVLNVGDHVISDGGIEWEAGAVRDDRENVPARIHDVAETFFEARQVATVQVPVSAPDFHGDGLEGDVAVIGTDRTLHASRHAAFGKQLEQSSFVIGRDRRGVPLSGLRGLAKLIKAALSSEGGIVRRDDLRAPFGFGHLCPLHALGFASSANFAAGELQHAIDRAPRHSVALRDRVAGLARLVGRDNFSGGQVGRATDGAVVGAEKADDDFRRDAELARKLLSGDAGPVFLDKIVARDVVDFRGHVFNLETPRGFYSANGIVTHNCRCAWIPVVKEGSGITLNNRQFKAAA
jgi:SPP1 gp7 family putative phage head morphogenesis protein